MAIPDEILNPSPIYPQHDVYLSQHDLAVLAEQIYIAAMRGCDPRGLRICVRGQINELPDLAAKIVGEWLHAKVRVLDEISLDPRVR